MAFINLATVYTIQGDLISSIEECKNLTQTNKEKGKKLLGYCGLNMLIQHKEIRQIIILFENKEFQECKQMAEKLLKKYSKNIVITCYSGLVSERLGDDEEATERLKITILQCLELPKEKEIICNYFFKKSKDTLDLMGVNLNSLFSAPVISPSPPPELLEEPNMDEFQEFDIQQEPAFDMKTYLYTINNNAHFERKKELERRFGTPSKEDQFEKDNHSEISESSIAQYDPFRKENLQVDKSFEEYDLSGESSSLISELSHGAMQRLQEKIMNNYNNLNIT